jgi:plasmid stability protein
MNAITIDFDLKTIEALERRATAHGHSIEDEVRKMVADAVKPRLSREEFIRRAEAVAAMTPKGIKQTDSTLLIREDRDR